MFIISVVAIYICVYLNNIKGLFPLKICFLLVKLGLIYEGIV